MIKNVTPSLNVTFSMFIFEHDPWKNWKKVKTKENLKKQST